MLVVTQAQLLLPLALSTLYLVEPVPAVPMVAAGLHLGGEFSS